MKEFIEAYRKLITEEANGQELTVCDSSTEQMFDPKWINPSLFMHNYYKIVYPTGENEFIKRTLSIKSIREIVRNKIKKGKFEDFVNSQICVYQHGPYWDDEMLNDETFDFFDFKPLGAFILKDDYKIYWKPYTYTGEDALTKEEAQELFQQRKAIWKNHMEEKYNK